MAIGIGIGLPFGKKATPNPVAQAPVNTTAPVISPAGNQVIGTLFTANSGSWFATRPLTFDYRWTRNGTPISGATSQTYTSVSADEGQTLRCEVRGVNAFGTSAYVASSNSSTGVSLPVNTVAPVISGSTTLGSVLTTTDGTWTGTATITFTYQWKRGGISIGGATASTYTLVAADSSANIICEVTGTNVAGSVAANSNTITASNFNPVNTVAPTLSPSGTQSTGTVITLGNGTWAGATPITFEYRWTRDNIVISGQTSNTYTIVAGDDGTVIKGEVRGTNSLSTSAYVVTSNQVDAVNVAPFVGVLDLVSNTASAALSLRKLRTAYSGSAVRIRRSGDNAESDIGFLNNEFDVAAAQAFCIAGGGAQDGFIVTWYDQSPSGVNYTQSTAAQQVKLVNAGVVYTNSGKASVLATNSAKYLRASNLSLGTSMTAITCAKWTATDKFIHGGSSTDSFFGNLSNNVWLRNASGTDYNAAESVNVNRIHTILNNANAFKIRTNGVDTLSNTNTGNYQINFLLTGLTGSDFYRFSGNFQEFIAYNNYVSDFSLIETNQNTYYGYY